MNVSCKIITFLDTVRANFSLSSNKLIDELRKKM